MTDFWVLANCLVLLGMLFLVIPLWHFRHFEGILIPALLIVLLPLISGVFYWHWGNYEAVRVNNMLREKGGYSSRQLVKDLEVALKKQPENYRAWYLLGESWMQLRHFELAAEAFRKVTGIIGDEPQALSKYAQALFLANGRQMNPQIEELATRVLLQLPDDRTALGLKGIAAFEKKRYRDAMKTWEKLLSVTDKPETRKMIESGIKKARALEDSAKDD